MNRLKVVVALIFLAGVVASLAGQALAYPPFLAKSKKFGAKDCTFCHVDPDGGPPWNERGQWLIAEKQRRKADVVDVEWLAEYKPGSQPAKAEPAKPVDVKPASTASPVEQELLKLEREWLDAYTNRDAAAMERIEADDFVITFPNGSMSNKAQQVNSVKQAGSGPPPQFQTEGTKVRMITDDVAILSGIVTGKYNVNGKEVVEKYRYTDVWAKRGGRWQVASSHLSSIATPQSNTQNPNQGAAAVKVDPNVFEAYVGEYELPMFNLVVTREGDKLFGQPPGDTKEELVPLSESEFTVKNVNAKIKFVKDSTGKVTHMMVNLNSQDFQGKKIK